jgi:hypothetical protein
MIALLLESAYLKDGKHRVINPAGIVAAVRSAAGEAGARD